MKLRKEKLLDGLDLATCVGAEIGPLNRPLVSKSVGHVIYIDHGDTQQLREKYADDKNVNVNDICVDAVWGNQTLQQSVDGYFKGKGQARQALDYVVASHVIEHVPDLITWLAEIRSILKTDGQVRLAVPDRRFTFDYLRRTTSLPEVLAAFVDKARMPNTQCLLDFCLNAVVIDSVTAWQGPLNADALIRCHTLEHGLAVARDALENGNYHDVHCWVFTPESFAALFCELSRHGLIDFACAESYDTEVNDMEFFVNLRVCENAFERTQSWQSMLDQVRLKAPAAATDTADRRAGELALG